MPPDIGPKLLFASIAGVACIAIGLSRLLPKSNKTDESPSLVRSIFLFCYSCFLKPHKGDGKGTQQDALESFYKAQAGVYDSTRKTLLRGREDMLALVAAQLKSRAQNGGRRKGKKTVWVDVGGGTGWNIEAMSEFVNVPEFFSSVYLVDFSPSLCEVARKRFARLGWQNVKVICEDARKFRLEDYENDLQSLQTPPLTPRNYFDQRRPEHGGADLITMSYSLSMMPDFFSIIDSLSSLLSPNGVIGVVDFYVQSKVDVSFRNHTGGLVGRHVNFFTRTFWRAWFEIDRVSLEPSRRDYLEYRFGTVLNINDRNRALGYIPYYVWLGCHKKPFSSSSLPHEIIEHVDALATESPRLLPANGSSVSNALSRAVQRAAPEIRSKAFDAAIQNLSSNLPLPAFFYQNHHWRIYYDDQLKKHTQFNDEYIYAFTWEDSRVDAHLLNLKSDDVVLAITSAGDNILSYAAQSPARTHAVDLNPTQNHLLELKVASYMALPYEDFWKLFGKGKHPDFRSLLISKLSPHLSSRAFQYWLSNSHIFTTNRSLGLYDTGGSKHAIRIFRWISYIFGCREAVKAILEAKTLNEQREIWRNRIRPALLSKLVSKLVVSQESFLWTALGVPKNQLAMIEADHATSEAVCGSTPTAKAVRSHAIWHYMVNTLDPMVESTHIAADNPYYHVCLTGKFSRKCHPDYLSPQAHARLSRPGAFDGLRIHTDEIDEVIARMTPGTLTVAVVMDSMDWFDPDSPAAAAQISKLNRALKMGGRVMLRSSALKPWYVETFAAHGFQPKRVGARNPGECIDRVNMYASCWICTKVQNLPPPTPEMERVGGAEISSLSI
ncbi:putative 3-amino-3-carboxypropyl transferase protein [Phaeoacremonium minimum UCRPA7]|uniref:Putative 3-amino-3-carboxypropyl transferase protein n=1 Tax=Phaeoacremonium minimum (strain UCR-PA7) TaxID=1286976 RepID=R8BGA4_PHAM7|nr:putative 3-amino-3-carboxypropyl transferase protein [Phaeoacremonium minimum UCRPA7]EON98336.1 putative 3-amino-3-carboxypropyl transferase protein [Phaeoacremonium minimum UCRPA7]